MKYLASCFAIILLLVAASAQASPALGYCVAVEELSIAGLDRMGESFTTPPYIALESLGRLQRLARRSHPLRSQVPLSDDQSDCIEAVTGARLSAVRAGASYRYKLQAPARTVLIFHVADLVGGEALVSVPGQRLLAKADRLLEEDRSAEAADLYREVFQAGVPPWEAAVAHAALGRIEKSEGRLESALGQYTQAVEIYPRLASAKVEKTLLEEEIERIQAAQREERRDSLVSQIATLQEEGSYQEAVPLAEEALELAEQDFGSESQEVAEYLYTLAELLEATEQYAEAEPLFSRSLTIREETLGADHPETVEARSRIEAIAQLMSQEEEAVIAPEQVAESALPPQAREEAETPWLDPEPEDVPETVVDWGSLFVQPGQIEKAISTKPKAVELEPAKLTDEGSLETVPAVIQGLLSPPSPDVEPLEVEPEVTATEPDEPNVQAEEIEANTPEAASGADTEASAPNQQVETVAASTVLTSEAETGPAAAEELENSPSTDQAEPLGAGNVVVEAEEDGKAEESK